MPKVTVLMPVYNGERYLRESIESILVQSFEDFEFIIINDGSTDGTREIVLSYDDSRIRYLENEKNIDLTKSLNLGLGLAKGEYIARMDGDDVSLPERLEKQVEFLDNNKSFAMVGSCSELVDEYGGIIAIRRERFSPEQIYYRLHFGNIFPHASVMARRSVLESVGGYDEKFVRSQDYDLWNRISKTYPIGMLEGTLLRLRISKESLSNTQKESQRKFANSIFERDIRNLFPDGDKFIDDVRCFHDINILGWDNQKIGFRKIILLRKVNQEIIKNAPSYINREELKKVSDERVVLFLKKMIVDYIKIFLKWIKK